ncbi:hypothetical protein ZIOFF_037680 [Zingiber officinale]|uniref:PWWP domain-containing protein n=2 Tax=Zingiber officinale TaxID=94328 RepID=A0A8J5GGB7_ZINOF|nr:hypothetical protein ZIOFF_037680 [Zingiber officinale]
MTVEQDRYSKLSAALVEAFVADEVKIGCAIADPYMEVGSSHGPVDGNKAATDGHGFGCGFGESRVFKEIESVELKEEAYGLVLDRGEAGFSGSSKDAHGDVVMDPESVGFDDDSASEEVVVSDGVKMPHRAVGNWMNGFDLGDMVWGKVKSHPWWPGYLFNEAFASPSVRRARRDGHVLVAFFGDSSYGWFDPAELVPFAPHYEEKSKQTTLRPFVKAVEEAADEASRREALGLACYCRNKSNFGSAHVPGYFLVDVPGFEPWGFYSSKQIEDARKNFVPEQSVFFLKQLALCPLKESFPAIDQIKNVAKMLAYRRAVFEEFDETYAQAFGVEPVRPSLTGSMLNHPERFTPRAAPLSGQLVMPESLRQKKSSVHKLASAPKVPKPPSAKKNKYVLKRRDEQFSITAPVAGPPLLDFTSRTESYRTFYNLFPTAQQPPAQPSLTFQDASVHGDYVLQRREPSIIVDDIFDDKLPQGSPGLHAQGKPHLVSEQRPDASVVDVPVVISPRQAPQMSVIEFRKLDPVVSDVAADAKPNDAGDVVVVGGIPKVKKIKKRLRDVASSDPTDLAVNVKKKIKRKSREQSDGAGLIPDHVRMAKDDDTHRKSASGLLSIGPEPSKRAYGVESATVSFPFAFQLPEIDLSSRNLQLPELVADLHELALDPFYGIDRDAPVVALHVFLKFRSMVYQKSLSLSLHTEAEVAEIQTDTPPQQQQEPLVVVGTAEIAPAKIAKEGREGTATAKPPKPGFRPDDPVVAGRKRIPSDLQEDMGAKRQKKLVKVKAALASEKKSAISQKRNQKEAGSASTATPTAAATPSAMPIVPAKPSNTKSVEPLKKKEPPPPRVPCPTALVMKFPPRTTLPSIASLKARFARFGPLDLSGTRVYWKSNTCKVVYKFKPDAEAALNYVRVNEIFGQVKVHFYLRDADAPVPEQSADAGGQKQESRPSEGVQFRPGNGSSTALRSLRNPNQKPGQLKSILKKPGDDVGPSSSREAPRVKFMLDNVDGKPVMSPAIAGSSSSRSDVEAPPLSLLPSDSVINKTTKSGALLPPPPPLPLSALHSYPSRTVDNSAYIPPPPVTPVSSTPLPPRPLHWAAADRVTPPLSSLRGLPSGAAQPHNYMQHGDVEGRRMGNKDLANQMLSLMIRCSDIVSSVKSSLGYVPYHPL